MQWVLNELDFNDFKVNKNINSENLRILSDHNQDDYDFRLINQTKLFSQILSRRGFPSFKLSDLVYPDKSRWTDIIQICISLLKSFRQVKAAEEEFQRPIRDKKSMN